MLSQENIKNNFLLILKWLIFLIIAYILQNAILSGGVRPFYYAFYFVLIWCNQNIFLSSLIYLLSSILYQPSIDYIAPIIISILVVLFFYFLHYKLRKPMNIVLLCCYAFFSQLYYFYVNTQSLQSLLNMLFQFILGLVFLIALLTFFQSLILKKNGQILSVEQMVCGAVFLSALCLGLSQFEIYGIQIVTIFSLLLIFLFSVHKPAFASCVVALSESIGVSLYSFDTSAIILYCCYAIFFALFVGYNKLVAFFSVVACDVFFRLYLIVAPFGWQSIFSITVSFVLFILLNPKLSNKINQYFFLNYDKLNLKNIVNRSREHQYRQLIDISLIFFEMERVFSSMVKGSLPLNETKQMLVQELSQSVCKDCTERSRCLRLSTKQTLEIFSFLIGVALEKGKITLIDIPNALSSKCAKVNIIIATINNMVAQYKKYSTMQNNMDTSKLLIGEQLGGVGKIMQNLAQKISENIEFDTKRENAIIEELNYNNIECNEAVVYKSQNEEVSTCLLIVNSNQLFADTISKIVSKILKNSLCVVCIENSQLKGYSNVYLKSTPKYDLIFGSAQKEKAGTEHSGDTFSYIRLSDDKILFAISDGMGSGEKAYKVSSTAISLIENFYKAGFDNETILSSVNKLLTLSASEIFSAIDIVVVDLRLGVADIIKIGAPIGFIKHKFDTDIIESGALPLGILEELKPNIQKKIIQHGDNIILMSDGVVDSFETFENAHTFINNLQSINPQTMAEEILAQAIDNDKQSPNDDMTIVVGRIINKV